MRLSVKSSLWILSLGIFCIPALAEDAAATKAATAGASHTQHVPRNTGAIAGGCPLTLDVRHGSGITVLHRAEAGDSFQNPAKHGMYKAGGQTLDLNMHNLGLLEIASIDAVVGVDSGAARMMPVTDSLEGADAELPMHLPTAVRADKDAAVSWRVASANPVLYVEIKKITYLDGSTWGGSHSCRVTPNPLMLLSSR